MRKVSPFSLAVVTISWDSPFKKATHISGGQLHDGAGAGGAPVRGDGAAEGRIDDARLPKGDVVSIPSVLKPLEDKG